MSQKKSGVHQTATDLLVLVIYAVVCGLAFLCGFVTLSCSHVRSRSRLRARIRFNVVAIKLVWQQEE